MKTLALTEAKTHFSAVSKKLATDIHACRSK
jgi:hypothetical protein